MERIPLIVYRDVVLALSETFVAAPAPMLTRYEPWFTGTRLREHPMIDPKRVIAPDANGSLPAWRAALFKITGRAPRAWIERLRALRPALMHVHFGTDGVFARPLARALGVPMIVTFLGFDATTERALGPVWTIYKQKRRRLFRQADLVLAVSEFIRERLIAADCPPERVLTHHLSVDTEHWTPPARDPRRPRTVLYVGRLVEKKGCSDLLAAFARVQQQERDVRLAIIGDGPLRARLEEQARTIPGVEFLGARKPDEIRRALEEASVFALPSRTARSGDAEGLPVSILEAQSMALPVLSTRHAGIPEAVLHGETGLLCAEKDVDALSENLLRLVRDEELRRSMGDRGRARMVAHFDLRKQTAKLESIYDATIARAKKR